MMFAVAGGDPDSISKLVAAWAVYLVFAIPAAACLQFAITSKGSRRKAYISGFLGLLFLVQFDKLPGFLISPGAVLGLGFGRLLAAAAGVVFGILALVERREDQKVSWLGPSLGIVACLLHGLGSFGPPKESEKDVETIKPWTHQSEKEGYSITLPSAQWTLTEKAGYSSAFTCPKLSSRVSIVSFPESRDAFEARVKGFQANQLPKLEGGRWEKGKSSAGDDFVLIEGISREEKAVFQVKLCTVYLSQAGRSVVMLCDTTLRDSPDAHETDRRAAAQAALASIIASLR